MLCLAQNARAQMPILDSVAIDEDSSILLCYGSFITSSGATVHIADSTLAVLSQTDTLIRAAIPMSGHGAAGPVSVEINGLLSGSKLITYFHVAVFDIVDIDIMSQGNNGGGINNNYTDSLLLRCDLQSHINSRTTLKVKPSLASLYTHTLYSSVPNEPENPLNETGRPIDTSIIDPVNRTITHHCYVVPDVIDDCPYPCDPVSWDSTFGFPFHNGGACASGAQGTKVCGWMQSSPTEFPPPVNEAVKGGLEDNNPTASLVTQGGKLLLELSSSYSSARIDVFDILGHKCATMNQSLNTGENLISLNDQIGTPGEYILRVQSGNEVRSLKFIKLQ